MPCFAAMHIVYRGTNLRNGYENVDDNGVCGRADPSGYEAGYYLKGEGWTPERPSEAMVLMVNRTDLNETESR